MLVTLTACTNWHWLTVAVLRQTHTIQAVFAEATPTTPAILNLRVSQHPAELLEAIRAVVGQVRGNPHRRPFEIMWT